VVDGIGLLGYDYGCGDRKIERSFGIYADVYTETEKRRRKSRT
jgi:hypothetical protein